MGGKGFGDRIRVVASGLAMLCLMLGSVSQAQGLVSQGQVEAAKNRAIFWTLLTLVLLGLGIFQLIRFFKKKP